MIDKCYQQSCFLADCFHEEAEGGLVHTVPIEYDGTHVSRQFFHREGDLKAELVQISAGMFVGVGGHCERPGGVGEHSPTVDDRNMPLDLEVPAHFFFQCGFCEGEAGHQTGKLAFWALHGTLLDAACVVVKDAGLLMGVPPGPRGAAPLHVYPVHTANIRPARPRVGTRPRHCLVTGPCNGLVYWGLTPQQQPGRPVATGGGRGGGGAHPPPGKI